MPGHVGGVTDRQARFRAIFDETRADVSGYVSRRTLDRHGTEDVLSETYSVVWRRVDDAPGPDGLRPWVFTIARNVLANAERSRRRRSRLLARLQAVSPAPSTVAHDTAGDPRGVAVAFARLRPQDRDLLVMAGVEGLDAAAMAEVLGCSSATLHVRLHRARNRFRRELIRCGMGALLPARSERPGTDQGAPAVATFPKEAR